GTLLAITPRDGGTSARIESEPSGRRTRIPKNTATSSNSSPGSRDSSRPLAAVTPLPTGTPFSRKKPHRNAENSAATLARLLLAAERNHVEPDGSPLDPGPKQGRRVNGQLHLVDSMELPTLIGFSVHDLFEVGSGLVSSPALRSDDDILRDLNHFVLVAADLHPRHVPTHLQTGTFHLLPISGTVNHVEGAEPFAARNSLFVLRDPNGVTRLLRWRYSCAHADPRLRSALRAVDEEGFLP